MKFDELGICEPLLRALREAGYQEPTPIQKQAIPFVLKGDDVLGCAQTGTGKTAAFAVPILQCLDGPREKQAAKRPIRALILTPTRELALQIFESFQTYGRYTKQNCAVIFGGVSQTVQLNQLKKGVDVLVATPGRLWDFILQKQVSLSSVTCFVLDEADRMLDMGFFPDVKRIIHTLPQKRQTLLFSATMPPEIQGLADSLLHSPARISVTPAATPAEAIHQCVYMVDRCNKRALLAHIIREKGLQQTLVFTRTKHGADRVARDLRKNGISSDSIHGDKSQGARQRALFNFKAGKIIALVATDIAARGIDISGLPYVINFDLPEVPETYVHRIGRTGRAGLAGTALSLCDGAQTSYLIDIEELTGRRIEEVEKHPYPMTGEQPAKPEPSSTEGQRGPARNHCPRKDAPRTEQRKPPQPQQEKRLPMDKRVKPQEIIKVKPAPTKEGTKTCTVKSGVQQASRTATRRAPAASAERKEKRPMPPHAEQAGTPVIQTGKKYRQGRITGRRVIDNDSAQAETKPLPARELPPSLRARIAAKVAAVLNGHQDTREIAIPPTQKRRNSRGRSRKPMHTKPSSDNAKGDV